MADCRDDFKLLFENTYISAKWNNERIYTEMISFLNKVISFIPEKLYRYRKIDEYTLRSFENGTISVCKAKCFSDKYDSLIYVNVDSLVAEMRNYLGDALKYVIDDIKQKNPQLRAEKAARICLYLEQGMTENEVVDRVLTEECSEYLNGVRRELKQREGRFRDSDKTARIACFTENVQSKYMWDTYAGGYSGFALEYDLRELFNKCFHMCIPAYVFPIIYSDERPDLTRDEANHYVFQEAQEKGWLKRLEPIRPFLDINLLSGHKPFLYKDKEEYGHEKEWRILYYDENSCEDYIEIPDDGCLKAIFYGMDIKPEDYEMLHQIAVKKGIKEYKVSIDEDSPRYSLKINL